MKNAHKTFLCIFIAFVFVSAFQSISTAEEVDQFTYDLNLVDSLAKLEMYDYAILQLDLMEEKYPEKKEVILIEKGRTLALQGNWAEGKELIKQIDSSSPHHAQARLTLANLAFEQGDEQTAYKAYQEFFAEHNQPVSKRTADILAFRRAIFRYSNLLDRRGKSEEAAQKRQLLQKFPGEFAASMRQIKYMNAHGILQQQAEKYPDVEEDKVRRAIQICHSLKWERDGTAAASYVQRAKAHVLLGEHDKAIEILKTAGDLLGAIDKALKEKDHSEKSPLAGAHYYYARALKGKARSAFDSGEREKAREFLLEAVTRVFKVMRGYTASPWGDEAVVEFDKLRTLLSRHFSVEIDFDRKELAGDLIRIQEERARTYFSGEQYEKAVPIYKKALKTGWRHKRILEYVLPRLIYCYGQLNRFLEAQALAAYAEDLFPDAQETAEAHLRVGAMLNERLEELEADSALRDILLQDRTNAWNRFVELAPAHPKAPDIAYFLAENKYERATELVERAETVSGEEKTEVNEKARRAFRKAIPLYERLVQKFGASHQSVRALYKMGWVYNSLDQPIQASEMFLRYVDEENKEKYLEDKLQAKFRSAVLLMHNGKPQEAVKHFKDILAWTEEGNNRGYDPDTEKVSRLRREATSLIGWSYDRWAGQFREQRDQLQNKIGDLLTRKEKLQTELSKLRQERQQIRKQSEKAKTSFRKNRDEVTEPVPTKTRIVERILKEKNLEDMSEEERTMAKRNAKEQAERELTEVLANENRRMKGEVSENEKVLKTVNAKVEELEESVEDKQKEIERTEDELKDKQTALKEVETDLKEVQEQISVAQEKVSKAEEQVTDYKKELEKAKNLQESDDAQEREKGTEMRREVAAKLMTAIKERRKLRQEYEEELEGSVKARAAKLEERKNELEQKIDDLTERRKELQHTKEGAVHELDVARARKRLVNKRLEALSLYQDYVRGESEQERKDIKPELSKTRQGVVEALKEFRDRKIELYVYKENYVSENIAGLEMELEEVGKRISELREQKQPLINQAHKYMEKALKRFNIYIDRYPEGDHAPRNLARIGTIHITFESFDKAMEALEQLLERYSETSAAKEARFDFARALIKNDRTEDAAPMFERVLENAEEQSTKRLVYITGNMLEGGFAEIAHKAGNTVLERVNSGKVTPKRRWYESTLYQVAKAALELDNYERSVELLRRLLKKYPNTGYYYDVKFDLAKAHMQKSPPDMTKARDNLKDVLDYAQESHIRQRAAVALAKTFEEKGGEESLKTALFHLQSAVQGGPPQNDKTTKWFERALWKSADLYRRINKPAKSRDMIAEYRDSFPDGQYREKVNAIAEQLE